MHNDLQWRIPALKSALNHAGALHYARDAGENGIFQKMYGGTRQKKKTDCKGFVQPRNNKIHMKTYNAEDVKSILHINSEKELNKKITIK